MKNFAILLLDTSGALIDCNAEAEDLFHAKRDQILGTTPERFSPEFQPDGSPSKTRALKLIEAALAGEPQIFEWRQKRDDGTTFDTEVSLNKVDLGGRTVLLTIHKDITELKQAEAARLESELMFRSIVENSHAGVFTIDEDFIITYANDMVSLLLERPNDEIIGHDFREFLDSAGAEAIVQRYLNRLQGMEVLPRYEFNIITASGTKRVVEINSSTIRDISGNLKIVGQVLDVTERKEAEEGLRLARENLELKVTERTAELQAANDLLRAEIARREQTEQALRRSETKYRHLVESGDTIILEMDTLGRAVSFNEHAQRFFGFTESEIIGKSIVGTIVPPHDTAGNDLQEMINRIIEHPEDYRLNENENIKKNGDKVWIIWTNQPILDDQGRLREILCVGIDHTQKKQEEQHQARLAVEQAALEERGRLARDLHDAVSQTLFSAGIIAEVLPRIWDKNPEEGKRRLEEVRQLTRGALAEMRTLLFELRPSALTEAEFHQLLRQLGESVTGRGRIPVEVIINGECLEPPSDVKVVLYRIAQEALNNILKHAGATGIKLILDCAPDRFTLEIQDNGHGFDLEQSASGSFGLQIMRERAEGIGAGLTIHSEISKGTSVKVTWPGKEKS